MSQQQPRDRGISGYSDTSYQENEYEVNFHQKLLRGSVVESSDRAVQQRGSHPVKRSTDDGSLVNTVNSIDESLTAIGINDSKLALSPQRSQTPRIEALDALKSMAQQGVIHGNSMSHSGTSNMPAPQRGLTYLKELFEECDAIDGVFLDFDGFLELLNDKMNLSSVYSKTEKQDVFNALSQYNKKYQTQFITFSDFNVDMNYVYNRCYVSTDNINVKGQSKKKLLPMETPKPEFNDGDIHTLVQRAIKRRFEIVTQSTPISTNYNQSKLDRPGSLYSINSETLESRNMSDHASDDDNSETGTLASDDDNPNNDINDSSMNNRKKSNNNNGRTKTKKTNETKVNTNEKKEDLSSKENEKEVKLKTLIKFPNTKDMLLQCRFIKNRNRKSKKRNVSKKDSHLYFFGVPLAIYQDLGLSSKYQQLAHQQQQQHSLPHGTTQLGQQHSSQYGPINPGNLSVTSQMSSVYGDYSWRHAGHDNTSSRERPLSARTNATDYYDNESVASPLSVLSYAPPPAMSVRSNTSARERSEHSHLYKDYSEQAQNIMKRQMLLAKYKEFFKGTVVLSDSQLKYVTIDPAVDEIPPCIRSVPHIEPPTPDIDSLNLKNHNNTRGHGLHPIPSQGTLNVPNNGGSTRELSKQAQSLRELTVKNVEEEHLYDEDRKLAKLLTKHTKNKKLEFIPNGLMTFTQFLEFVEALNIYNYEKSTLKHMFRYIYTEELPPGRLPPKPSIDPEYDNVNGMYIAHSELLDAEFDEVVEIMNENGIIQNNQDSPSLSVKKNDKRKKYFDEMLTQMVMRKLQDIYKTLKFDDLNAHPNTFLGQNNGMVSVGSEISKPEVMRYFDSKNAEAQAAHDAQAAQATQSSSNSSNSNNSGSSNTKSNMLADRVHGNSDNGGLSKPDFGTGTFNQRQSESTNNTVNPATGTTATERSYSLTETYQQQIFRPKNDDKNGMNKNNNDGKNNNNPSAIKEENDDGDDGDDGDNDESESESDGSDSDKTEETNDNGNSKKKRLSSGDRNKSHGNNGNVSGMDSHEHDDHSRIEMDSESGNLSNKYRNDNNVGNDKNNFDSPMSRVESMVHSPSNAFSNSRLMSETGNNSINSNLLSATKPIHELSTSVITNNMSNNMSNNLSNIHNIHNIDDSHTNTNTNTNTHTNNNNNNNNNNRNNSIINNHQSVDSDLSQIFESPPQIQHESERQPLKPKPIKLDTNGCFTDSESSMRILASHEQNKLSKQTDASKNDTITPVASKDDNESPVDSAKSSEIGASPMSSKGAQGAQGAQVAPHEKRLPTVNEENNSSNTTSSNVTTIDALYDLIELMFLKIDLNKRGYVNADTLKMFILLLGVSLSPDETDMLIKTLKKYRQFNGSNVKDINTRIIFRNLHFHENEYLNARIQQKQQQLLVTPLMMTLFLHNKKFVIFGTNGNTNSKLTEKLEIVRHKIYEAIESKGSMLFDDAYETQSRNSSILNKSRMIGYSPGNTLSVHGNIVNNSMANGGGVAGAGGFGIPENFSDDSGVVVIKPAKMARHSVETPIMEQISLTELETNDILKKAKIAEMFVEAFKISLKKLIKRNTIDCNYFDRTSKNNVNLDILNETQLRQLWGKMFDFMNGRSASGYMNRNEFGIGLKECAIYGKQSKNNVNGNGNGKNNRVKDSHWEKTIDKFFNQLATPQTEMHKTPNENVISKEQFIEFLMSFNKQEYVTQLKDKLRNEKFEQQQELQNSYLNEQQALNGASEEYKQVSPHEYEHQQQQRQHEYPRYQQQQAAASSQQPSSQQYYQHNGTVVLDIGEEKAPSSTDYPLPQQQAQQQQGQPQIWRNNEQRKLNVSVHRVMSPPMPGGMQTHNNNNSNNNNQYLTEDVNEEKIQMTQVNQASIDHHNANHDSNNGHLVVTSPRSHKSSKSKKKKKKNGKQGGDNLDASQHSNTFEVVRIGTCKLDRFIRKYHLTVDETTKVVMLIPDIVSEMAVEFPFDSLIREHHLPGVKIKLNGHDKKAICYKFRSQNDFENFFNLVNALRQNKLARGEYTTGEPKMLAFKHDYDRDRLNDCDNSKNYVNSNKNGWCYELCCKNCCCNDRKSYGSSARGVMFWYLLTIIIHTVFAVLFSMFIFSNDNDSNNDNNDNSGGNTDDNNDNNKNDSDSNNNSEHWSNEALLCWILVNLFLIRLTSDYMCNNMLINCMTRLKYRCVSFICHELSMTVNKCHGIIGLLQVGWFIFYVYNIVFNDQFDSQIEQILMILILCVILLFTIFGILVEWTANECSFGDKIITRNDFYRLHASFGWISFYLICFYAIAVAIWKSFDGNEKDFLDVFIYFPSFYISLFIIVESLIHKFGYQTIEIKGSDIELRVISSVQCELHISLNNEIVNDNTSDDGNLTNKRVRNRKIGEYFIKAASFVTLSFDNRQWIKLPVLSSFSRETEDEMASIHSHKHGSINDVMDQDNDSEPMLSDDDRLEQLHNNTMNNSGKKHKKAKSFPKNSSKLTDEQMQAQIVSYRSSSDATNEKRNHGNDDNGDDDDDDDDDDNGNSDNEKEVEDSIISERNPGYPLAKKNRTKSNNPFGNEYYYNMTNCDVFSVMLHGRSVTPRNVIHSIMHNYELLSDEHVMYLKYYPRNIQLSFVNFIQCYDNIFIIATDDRIIPALSYIMSAFAQKDTNFVYVLWFVNNPEMQYPGLLSNLRYYCKHYDFVDMAHGSHTMKQLIIHNLKKQLKLTSNNTFNAGFTLTTSQFGDEINQIVKTNSDLNLKRCYMYNQKSEWY